MAALAAGSTTNLVFFEQAQTPSFERLRTLTVRPSGDGISHGRHDEVQERICVSTLYVWVACIGGTKSEVCREKDEQTLGGSRGRILIFFGGEVDPGTASQRHTQVAPTVPPSTALRFDLTD